MDISFTNNKDRFNYRVCGIIINDNRILAIKNNKHSYYSLPGGRVMMGETAEAAVIREIQEELYTEATVVRPLWLNQSFFTKVSCRLQYHELCIYFLLKINESKFLERGLKFSLQEGDLAHHFEWLDFDSLKDLYFYPAFLKTEIFNLPDVFTLRTEMEQDI